MTIFSTDTPARPRPARAVLRNLLAWLASRVAEARGRQALRSLDTRLLRDAGLDETDRPAGPVAPLSRDSADELYRRSLGHRRLG